MINKEKWVEIIKDFHEKRIPILIPRDISIPTEVPINRAITIIGPRRAGKTYVMYQLINELLKIIKKEQVLYINLEKYNLLDLDDLARMLESFYELYPENKKRRIYLFLDEIQNVNKWEKFVRGCLDEGIKVYLSGSSSRMLSREIATSMRGRSLTYQILPFSFKEFLKARKIESSKNLSSSEKSSIIKSFSEYFNYGGYPEVVVYPEEKEKILSEILEVTISKDVIERAKIRNIKAIKILIDSIIVSKEFSVHKFYNYLKSIGVKAGKNVLYQYVEYLNDAFFCFMLRKFSYSYKKAEQSVPKPYIIDNGFFSIKKIDEKSRLMENLVFIELLRGGEEIAYYSDISGEIDFLIKEGRKVKSLIQVSYDINDFNTKEREVKQLIRLSKHFKCKNLLVITMDYEAEEKIKGRIIKFIPLWKWLLE